MVATIQLYLDPQVKKGLKELAAFQDKDPYIKTLKEQVTNQLAEVQDGRYAVLDGVIYFKNHKSHPFWRPMLPSCLENKVIKFVHLSLGHAGSEKCIAEIAHTFYIKNLGRKVREILSCCDVCQRVKHPNRSYEIDSRSHLPKKARGPMCPGFLWSPPSWARRCPVYISVLRCVKLYPLRAPTTKACLNKLTTDYFPRVIKPSCILSDHGKQFTSPMWKKKLYEVDVTVRYVSGIQSLILLNV